MEKNSKKERKTNMVGFCIFPSEVPKYKDIEEKYYTEDRAERRSRILKSKKYVNSGKMTTAEIDEYIKEQRTDERY